ncbi:MAG TPA: universal stress protein [Vicinamibacterales bacterium]|nr:universal stress protein [Vicinamibacterales bacterium]
MIAIRTVVCPVDFSPATGRQLRLAIDACRSFGGRLVLHHNVTDVSVGAGVGWMWHAREPGAQPATESADEGLRRLIALVPPGIPVETCITRGAATEAVLRVSDAAEADLVVLSAHAGKTEDHASVIEYLLARSSHAVLALHDPGEDDRVPRFTPADDGGDTMQTVLVPVSLSADAHAQLAFAAELARMFPVRLHVLHVMEPPIDREQRNAGTLAARPQLDALIPADLRSRAAIHVETGEPVPAIVEMARALSASCIVMGEHTRVPVKRWLNHDTARAVLDDAHCPVWYVPSPLAPALSLSRFALSDERSIIWGNV